MKFTLKLIGRVIIDNPGKLLALVIATLSFLYARQLPKSTYVEYCVTSFKDSGKYNYVIKSSQQYVVKTFDSYIKPDTNSNITYMETGGFEIFLYILAGAMLICIIVAMMVDDNSGWDLSENYRDALVAEIVVEQDGLFFNYVLNNRLIAKVEEKMKHEVDNYGLKSYVESYRRNRNLFIEYKGTTQAIRDNKIKHIQDES